MNYVALKPVNFGGKQYKIGEIIPEGVVDERRSLFLKKSGHIAEVASVNGAYAEDLNVNPNTLSIPLLQSKHELAVNAQQLLQFFATIQKTIEEAKIEIATMTEEDTPVLQLLHEIDSRKGIKAAVETRLADLSVDSDINPEETEEPEEQPEEEKKELILNFIEEKGEFKYKAGEVAESTGIETADCTRITLNLIEENKITVEKKGKSGKNSIYHSILNVATEA